MQIIDKVSLHYKSDTSDKEYHAEIRKVMDVYELWASWGRRGHALQSGLKAGSSDYASIKKQFDRLVEEKVVKGYQKDGVAPVPETVIPMMACGHSANGYMVTRDVGTGSEIRTTACLICGCTEQGAMPDLSARRARCDYFGRPTRKNECPRCKDICQCEVPSSTNLAFFKYLPDKEFDQFYCGCHSWD